MKRRLWSDIPTYQVCLFTTHTAHHDLLASKSGLFILACPWRWLLILSSLSPWLYSCGQERTIVKLAGVHIPTPPYILYSHDKLALFKLSIRLSSILSEVAPLPCEPFPSPDRLVFACVIDVTESITATLCLITVKHLRLELLGLDTYRSLVHHIAK